jgi:hypothetical protein
MYYTFGVAINDRVKDWYHKSVYILLTERVFLQELLKKFSAIHELHDETVMPLVLIGVD